MEAVPETTETTQETQNDLQCEENEVNSPSPSSPDQPPLHNPEKQLYPDIIQEHANIEVKEELKKDEPIAAVSGFSFWDLNGYKKTVKRIDDGAKLCDEMMKLVSEKAEIEALYMNRLRTWAKKWEDSITKSAEYGTTEAALKSMTIEANISADIHNQMYDKLLKQVYESISEWKKSNYHKSMMSWKETKAIEEGFSKAQKPWGKKFDEVNKCKKAYYAAHVSHNQAVQAEADTNVPEKQLTEDQLKKLKEKVTKTAEDVSKTRDKYKESIRDISNYNPKFEEDMRHWFGKAQQFEQERKEFVKNVLLQYHAVVEKSQFARNFSAIGNNLLESFNKMSSTQDVDWYARSYGASMPVSWPQFEEYDPSVTISSSNTSALKDTKATAPKEPPKSPAPGSESPKPKATKSGVCTTL